MNVLMKPYLDSFGNYESGIKRVIQAYHRYAKDFGIQFVKDDQHYDIKAIHAGADGEPAEVVINHGMYWSADYDASQAEYKTNANIIKSLRFAKQVTVPSNWVAETFRRDMRINPTILPHGIEWDEWQHDYESERYILWNKNRHKVDVCDATPLLYLSKEFPMERFLTTFSPDDAPPNIRETGLIPHDAMKGIVQRAGVYLSTTKETFGIGILEAMASGIPVLGWANGGNLDLVQHGVNGYLARPGNNDDLAAGLAYCLKHRKTLGDNGREMAKQWTWQKSMEILRRVFELAMVDEPETVSVVIPVYNKPPQQIERAIESVLSQTRKPEELIVVDDGSTDVETIKYLDKIEAEYTGYTGMLPEVSIIRQENQGVANARNNGIAAASGTFINCLDSDDWLEPDYIKTVLKPMVEDRSLGMSFTGMMEHRPDGSQRQGRWGGDAMTHMKGSPHCQVPTCCLFRRKAWERLGGYRQRYAPNGAGSEDAEFWLRQMAYGWRAQEATGKPLFNYSFLTGIVSGDRNYREKDWTAWHPFTKDGIYPFITVVPAKGISHPVHQYDEPDVSVIIPVGPGHAKYLIDALDSLEAQTFRNWEVIVVDDTGEDIKSQFEIVYPYIKWIKTTGKKGAGYARNRGAEVARGALLFWLDADDYLLPDALTKFIKAWNQTESIVYSDYLRIIHNVEKKDVATARNVKRVVEYDDGNKIALAKFRAFDFDCERAKRQPEEPVPYYWCLATTLVPKVWHDAIGGYDEEMESWEDADYHFRLVFAGHCFARVSDELVTVRSYSGTRLNRGLQIHENLIQYMSNKYKELEMGKGCGGCGGARVAVPQSTARTAGTDERLISAFPDEEMVKVKYNHPNKGNHKVYGQAINPLTGKKFDYGYRGGGQEFYVHINDAFTIDKYGNRTPSLKFTPVSNVVTDVKKPAAPVVEISPPKPTSSVVDFDEARAKARAETERKFAVPAVDVFEADGVKNDEAKPERAQVNATDAAIALAEKEGIVLAGIVGNGQGGKVLLSDVKEMAYQNKMKKVAKGGSYT